MSPAVLRVLTHRHVLSALVNLAPNMPKLLSLVFLCIPETSWHLAGGGTILTTKEEKKNSIETSVKCLSL